MKVHLILLMLGMMIRFTTPAQSVIDHGKLHVDGTKLKNEHGESVVLRGMSFGWHNWWPRFYNQSSVKWLQQDWGCTVVRAAMGVEPDQGYIKNPKESNEKIKAVIDGAINAGIYVIIDWHSHNINLKEAKQFFSEMAQAYGTHPNVIYEIFNEPDQESWAEVKAYSTEVIAAIRAIDPDNIILVGCPHWDQDVHLPAEDPITGQTNLMYTMHFYAGTHKQWLRDRCDKAIAKGLPLFVSESAGMKASGDGALNDEEWEKWIAWMEKNQISWVTWSVSDKKETCSVLLPQASSEGGWKDSDLKKSGVKSRELLKSYSGK